MRPVISFTDPLSYMRFGLMKKDTTQEKRIVPVSTVEMSISCINAIMLSEKPALHPVLRTWMMQMMSLVLHQFLTIAV
jgi:hypothetical protein